MNYIKKYNNKNYNNKNINKYTDLSKNKSFEMEIECLNRLKKYDHFPKIINYDRNKYILEITNCGKSLDMLKTHVEINEKELYSQISNIISFLKEEKIIHLDIKPKNICINSDKKIYLIDFDICVLDKKFTTKKLSYHYEQMKKLCKENPQFFLLKKHLLECKYIKVTNSCE